ncbi:chemotaxis protein [Streptomyces sp. NBC_01506]|uniref:baeRF3 domain-containing protein n=1 Tax=Streptomyces sp. NBC_01506 TaxID=2903887 RepID=UPI0038673B93
MDSNDLTPDVLRTLREQRPYPAVSLTMPTHRHDPMNDQDPVRLRNVLSEAVHRMEADPDVPKATRQAVRARLDQAVAEVDLRHKLDGLLILADAEEHQVWYLPREAPESVVISDTYLTRNLVAATAQRHHYWVLNVAANRATLWSGVGDSLSEHRADGFPMTPSEATWDVERLERIGNPPSNFMDEDTRKFMRSVDDAFTAVLATRPRPFHLVGVPPALALLEEAGSTARSAAGRLAKGGLTDGPAHVLAKAIRPVVEAYARDEEREVLVQLDDAKGRRVFAAGLDEVWEAVRDRRAALVAVEEHFQRSARISEGHLIPVDGADGAALGREVQDDIVDELVETALDGGARVVFLDDDVLVDHHRIAAVLRY